MSFRYRSRVLAVGLTTAVALLAGCGAGSRVAEGGGAQQVPCDVEVPEGDTTVNVLAYNSSAIDPFTNTMVSSCTKDGLTVKHDPIDFAGQVQRTQATLAGETGTFDIVETYGFVIPTYAAEEKLMPLDDLFAKYEQQYGLDGLNQEMLDAMSYEGTLYALPMQAQVFVMAYREDVFEDLGLQPPATFAQLREAAETIQQAGVMEHPVALPWLASSDIVTAYDAAMDRWAPIWWTTGQAGRTSTPRWPRRPWRSWSRSSPTWTRRSPPSTSRRCSSRCTTATPRSRSCSPGA